MKAKKFSSIMLSLILAFSCIVPVLADESSVTHTLVLSSEENADGTWSHTAVYDGETVEEYDYTWHIDPAGEYEEVKNAPGVYYTGTAPSEDAEIYIAHDITYYPELDTDKFVRQNYDGEQEWCYYYESETYGDYIFSTLPIQGSSIPTQMMHSEEDAYQNAVLHITEAGTYEISGDWHGQINIDLGEDAFDDESCKVTVILNGIDVTCTVAPALIFANVYECDNTWEDRDSYDTNVDTTNAGAVVILADDSVNNFSGTNIFRLLSTKMKSDEVTQKKYKKIDAAFYSYMSMNIEGETDGTGILNITSGFEGLDTELHLSINGGNVNIQSQDDGVNVNEDGVSVVAINGGSLHIVAGLGAEGDGIDSNGFLVINGGTVISTANPASDSGLDSDFGSYINGGYVVATGSTMDWAGTESEQVTLNLQFASYEESNEAIIITDLDGNVIFAYDPDKDETTGNNNRSYMGAVISCPELEVGESYYIYVGGDVYGTDVNGLYDISTVTGFSDEAIQQCYTGTSVGRGFGGGMGGGRNFEDFENMDFANMEQGEFERPERQNDEFAPQMDGENADFKNWDGQMPEMNGEMPEMNGQMPGMFGEQGEADLSNAITEFLMSSKVNAFSGVTDYVLPNVSETTGTFRDVAPGSYYEDAVNWAYDNGIAAGTSATTFSPEQACTRAQVVTFLWRAAGSPDVTVDNPFTDLEEDAYYCDAVNWAVSEGITAGTTETTFSPEDTVTRVQFVSFLYRYADEPEVTEGSAFTDISEGEYYYNAVLWAAENGVTAGTTETTFSPDDYCLRGQTVTFIYRYMG